jgi:ABC-2 type transport system ATP-binding protein
MAQTQKILEIRDVGIAYNGVQVIEGVSLDIHAGETFGLIGLNGTGKTSLIKTILSLRPQDTGSISIFGYSPANKAARARLAFLPERFEPAWFLTGIEFIKFSLQLYGRPFNAKDVIANAEKLALDPRALKRRVQTYSKGMRQKLGLIGTIMTGCDLLILDEPMSGLDPFARTLVKDMIMECRRAGRTVFLSSHILADMDEICDRIAIVHEGTLRFIGTPAAFRQLAGSENLERAFLQFILQKKAA